MLRLTVLGAAVPVGLATGILAWLAAGGGAAGIEQLESLSTEVRSLRAPKAVQARRHSSVGDLIANPIFALSTGVGALREPALRLDGVSMSSRRTAALVSIDGKVAEWMSVGESRDGVTLQGLTVAAATFETPLGSKQLGLGEQSAASAPVQPDAQAGLATGQAIVDQIPPGFRPPAPPASAPPATS